MMYYNASTIPYFNFTALWNITNEIKKFNAFDPRLFYPIDTETNLLDRSRTLLQPAACFSLVKDQKWVPYTLSDVHERVLVWKLPLFQLIAQIPRPPLGIAVECFSIIHLLGDPVDSLWSLLHKLMMCQKHAQQWRSQWSDAQIWKTSALIEISYDEWEIGGIVKDRLHQAL